MAEWKCNIGKYVAIKGITQRQLAEAIGATEVSVSRYISGDRIPKAPTCIKIAKVLDCSVEDLYSFEIPKQTNDDRINAMSPEEKAEFFANFSVEKLVGEWCKKLCPQRLAGVEECDCPYEVKESIEGWLKAEAKEEA